MMVDEIDGLSDVVESLRDAGWNVMASSFRLVASKNRSAFSIARKRDGNDNFEISFIEIFSQGKDHQFKWDREGSAVELATFAATAISVFCPIMSYLSRSGFELWTSPHLEVNAQFNGSGGNIMIVSLKIDHGMPRLPKMTIFIIGEPRVDIEDIVDPEVAIAAVESYLNGPYSSF
jgi:hypothetical protein